MMKAQFIIDGVNKDKEDVSGADIVDGILWFPFNLIAKDINYRESLEAGSQRIARLTEMAKAKNCSTVAAEASGEQAASRTEPQPAALGADYYDGLRAFDDGDFAAAVKAWKAAAMMNDSKAQYRLGELYRTGQGVPQNFVKAHQYLNLAAAQGHTEARTAREAFAQSMTTADISRAQSLIEDAKHRIALARSVSAPAVAETKLASLAPQPVSFDGEWVLELAGNRVRTRIVDRKFSVPVTVWGWRGEIHGEIDKSDTLIASGYLQMAKPQGWAANNLEHIPRFTAEYKDGGFKSTARTSRGSYRVALTRRTPQTP